jgi:hypothetical protein
MPFISGSFSGKITKQSSLSVPDQPNHEIGIGEVNGVQSSPDPLWNNSKISYWAFHDLLDGKGSQRGYFNNVHADGGRDFGTFEGLFSTSGGAVTVQGTFEFTGGDGQYRGINGGGKFKTVMKSETELEATWDGNYEIARAQAG